MEVLIFYDCAKIHKALRAAQQSLKVLREIYRQLRGVDARIIGGGFTAVPTLAK